MYFKNTFSWKFSYLYSGFSIYYLSFSFAEKRIQKLCFCIYYYFKFSCNFLNFKLDVFLLRCGTEAVIGYWDNVLLVIGREGDHINYGYDSAVRLVPEMDGVRVLSAFSHEMIQKVPLVVQQIFRINSTDPSSYLLEASKQFQVCNFILKLKCIIYLLQHYLFEIWALWMKSYQSFCSISCITVLISVSLVSVVTSDSYQEECLYEKASSEVYIALIYWLYYVTTLAWEVLKSLCHYI